MSYAPLIIAGISALSSFMGSRAQKVAAAQRARKMAVLASPEHLRQVIGQMMPFYRELVNAGLGPQFIQESSRALSEAGMRGTGVGEALAQLGRTAPSVIATQEATGAGEAAVNREMEGLNASPIYTGNPLGEALAAAARGYFGTAQAQRTQQQTSMDNVMAQPSPVQPYPNPGIDVTNPPAPPLFPVAAPKSTNPLDRPGVNI